MRIDQQYIFVVLPFICFIAGYFLCNLIIGNKTYVTPQLTGLSVYEAIKQTSPHQINIRIISEKECKDILPGTILHQKPTPGRLIKTHQPILVTTTKSAPDIFAPHVLQQPLATIEKLCHDMHIKSKSYALDYPAPDNTCISQLPEANNIVQDNKMIFYFAKEKSNTYLMPNFTNQSLREIIDFLKEYSTKITVYYQGKKITEPYDPSLTITAQKPIAGSLITFKSPLHIHLETVE